MPQPSWRSGDVLRHLWLAPPLLIIFVGLVVRGADDAALASLLTAALSAWVIVQLLAARSEQLKDAWTRHWPSALAAFAFIGWALFTALPIGGALEHPWWRAFGIDGPHAISINPTRTLEGAASFAGALAAFCAGALSFDKKKDRDSIVRLIAIGALTLAVYALAVHFHRPPNIDETPRLMLHFANPNAAATLFGMLTLILFAAICRRALSNGVKGVPPQLGALGPLVGAPLSSAALILCAACLLLTASRGGLAAFTLAFALLIALWRNGARPGVGFALPALVLVVGGLGVVGAHFALSRAAMFAEDAHTRTLLAETHWRAFLERPWLGHGLNTFRDLNEHYTAPETWDALHSVAAAHNIYVQLLEETGVFGFALFAAMLAPLLIGLARAALSKRRSGALFAAAALSAFVLAALHGLVDFGLQVPATAALLAYCMGAFSRELSE
ncbi:MAG: O-antigen ligase family protein [Terricaulis sp.]